MLMSGLRLPDLNKETTYLLTYILHRFRDIAFDRSKIRYIRLPLLCLTPPTEKFLWDNLSKILPGCQ